MKKYAGVYDLSHVYGRLLVTRVSYLTTCLIKCADGKQNVAYK